MSFSSFRAALPNEEVAVASTVFHRVKRLAVACAVQDWLVLAYHLLLWFAAYQGTGPRRRICMWQMATIATVHITALVLVRGGIFRQKVLAPLLYRAVVYGGVQGSYFLFRDLLPTAAPYSLDAQLYRLDTFLFGVEPTLWTDQFVSSATTEWFSFFYVNYFLLLGSYVVPMVLFVRRLSLAAEFVLGCLSVFCIGHVLYMVVPGYGPYRYLAEAYHHTLPHGFWYDAILQAVASLGAQKDIFPSLHTAAPTFLVLFSFLNRDQLPFKYVWPFVAFFTANIIGATIFLRWHYLIDVVAGLALATVAALGSHRVARWENQRRQRLGLPGAWPSFLSPEQNDGRKALLPRKNKSYLTVRRPCRS